MNRRAFAALVLVLLVMLPPLAAHDVIVEQVVEMVLEPHGDHLVVRFHVPIGVIGDPLLPGLMQAGDASALDATLRIVAADVARNLDVQQAGVALQGPVATARVAADRASTQSTGRPGPGLSGPGLDIELTYAGRVESESLSARVNAFDASRGPVRTNARYRAASGRDNTVSVTGPPLRVTFDPGAGAVLLQFVARGVRAVFGSGDHLLFLVCVLLPLRRARSASALFAAGALGQAIGMALALLWPGMTVDSLTAIEMVAGSAVVIASLQSIVGAGWRWVGLLTLAFGGLNGFTFGHALVVSEQFAGAHRGAAEGAFVGVVLLGELWLGVLAWATRAWLDDRGAPERMVSVLGSAIIAHTAIHRVMDRGQIVAQAGLFGGERAIVWLALGWVSVMLAVALVESSQRARRGHEGAALGIPGTKTS